MAVPGPPRLKTQPLVGINDIPGNTGFIKVSWLPPLDDGGSPLTNYSYELRDTGGGIASSGGIPADQTEITFNGFPNGYEFIFYINASNSGFGGPYGPTVQTQPWQVGAAPTVGPATIAFSADSISSGLITYTPPSTLPTADIRWYVGRLSPYWDQTYYQQQKGRAATNSAEIYMSSIGIQQISILGVQAVNCPGYSPAKQLTYFPGTGSALFDGTVDMILSPGFQCGDGPFTIQFWVKCNTISNTPIFGDTGKGALTGLRILITSPTSISILNDNASYDYTLASAISTGTWTYIVVVRDSTNDETVWVDGTQATTGVQSDTNVYSPTIYIANSGEPPTLFLDGYLTNIRVIVGSALYSPSGDSTVPVPTAQFLPVSGTELLLLECNSDCLSIDFVNIQGISTGATWSSDSPF